MVTSQKSEVRWYGSHTKIWSLQFFRSNFKKFFLQGTLWSGLDHRYLYCFYFFWELPTDLVLQPNSCPYKELTSSYEKMKSTFFVPVNLSSWLENKVLEIKSRYIVCIKEIYLKIDIISVPVWYENLLLIITLQGR